MLRPLLIKPTADLTIGDMQQAIDRHASAKSAAFVVRSIRPVLKWGAAPGRRHLPADLAQLAVPPSRGRGAAPAGSRRDELAALLPVLRASDRAYAAALRLMALTLTRRSEIAAARWRDVDLNAGTWTIPETKNGEPHVIPLSRQAIALLRNRIPEISAPGSLVFATTTGAPLGNWDGDESVATGERNRRLGPGTTCGEPGPPCSGKWASCRTSSKPR